MIFFFTVSNITVQSQMHFYGVKSFSKNNIYENNNYVKSRKIIGLKLGNLRIE